MTAAVAAQRAPLTGPVAGVALALDPTIIFQRAGMQPDSWQRDILFDEDDWWLLLCCRQAGKTVTIASLALYVAMTKPGALILILTPSQRQSVEVLRQVSAFYLAVHGAPLQEDHITTLKVELGNDSRIIALPGADDKTLRVYAGVDLILADEAARISADIFHAVFPMLATSGGRAILASTPWFKRGFFFNEWQNGGDAWRRVKVTADDCPRISRKFLAREKKSKPRHWYLQEYYCRWGSAAAALFDPDVCDALLTDEVVAYAPNRLRFV